MTNKELNKAITDLVLNFLLINRSDNKGEKLTKEEFIAITQCADVLGTQFFRSLFNIMHIAAESTHDMEEAIDEYATTISNTFKSYCRDRMVKEVYSQETENE